MKADLFDREQLQLQSLSERMHDLDLSIMRNLDNDKKLPVGDDYKIIAERILQAKKNKASIIMMFGGHVIRSGIQKYIIDLIRGYYS